MSPAPQPRSSELDRKGLQIGSRLVGGSAPCFVIAEIGINHGGVEDVAAAMVKAAAAAGADAAKLQTVSADESYVPGTASYREFKGKELSLDAHRRLVKLGEALGIVVFTTPADLPSLEIAIASGMRALKVSSGMLASTPLLSRMASTDLPLIISTGMADLAEIDLAVAAVGATKGRFALLQCTSLYPAPAHTLNLSAMRTLAERYHCPVGYSDHHDGDLAVIAAIAKGASVIEKHFTFDRTMPGADHALSLEPAEFKAMVDRIRRVEKMIGDGRKVPSPTEVVLKGERLRCIVARRDLPSGTVLSAGDLALKRPLPGTSGLLPHRLEGVVGRRLARALLENTPLGEADLT